jgi:hypothetical protein
MSRFIKFSNIIINTAFIKHVEIDKLAEKFTIHLSSSPHSGSFFLGTGYFNGHSSYIWASKAEHPESYATVEKWIKSLNCVSND